MAAVKDVLSVVAFHVQTFSDESMDDDSSAIDAFVAGLGVAH